MGLTPPGSPSSDLQLLKYRILPTVLVARGIAPGQLTGVVWNAPSWIAALSATTVWGVRAALEPARAVLLQQDHNAEFGQRLHVLVRAIPVRPAICQINEEESTPRALDFVELDIPYRRC